MAILKCKMCGGDLNVSEGATICECEYCGSQQTIPSLDDEKKIKLFDRANRLRMACEFDKAYGVYEAIASEFDNEAEAYWGLVLCKYGIEYVDDPSGKKIPTCHRSSFESILDDENFDLVLENADVVAKKIYREEAKAIEEIRKGIIEISSKEEPYDIFICYKETDSEGNRTIDSVIAQDVYDALIEKKYRVFFARITLEDKLGQEYEPYIFSALHSAKVMLVFGTDYDYFNAVWVKNEWSRFLKLIESGEKKTIVPCYKGIDAYDLPKEFAKLQAQDMGKVGAIQDLLRGIEKIIGKKVKTEEKVRKSNDISSFAEPLVHSATGFLQNREFSRAKEFFEKALEYDATNENALLGILLAEQKRTSIEDLANGSLDFTKSITYTKLLSCCSSEISARMNEAIGQIKNNYYKNGEVHLENREWKKAREKFVYLIQFEPRNVDYFIGKLLSEMQACDISKLNTLPFETNITYKDICSFCDRDTRIKLEGLNEEAKTNHKSKIRSLLSEKRWKDTISYCDVTLFIIPNDEDALLGRFLAEQQCSTIQDLASKDINYIKSPTFVKLMNVCGEDISKEIDDAYKVGAKRLLEEANASLEREEWDKARSIYVKLLVYDSENQALLLGKLLAEVKCPTFKQIFECENPLEKNQTYLTLLNVGDEELKKSLKEINEGIKKRLFISMDKYLKERNWYDLNVCCNKLQNYYPNDERVLLAQFFSSVSCNGFEELKNIDEIFTSKEAYKKLITYASDETKKQLDECARVVEKRAAKARLRKKIISIGTKLGIVAAIAVAIVVFVFYRKTDKFIYGLKKTEGGYMVTRYKGKETEVEILSEYKGKPIVRIDDLAFEDKWDIDSVVVPNSVTSIGFGAFKGCTGIKELSIPFVGDGGENTHLTYIFGAEKPTDNVNCPSMRITLTNCTEIGDYAFYGANPSNIKWESDVKRIGDYAFYSCNKLAKVLLSDTIESIGESAFEECSYVEQFFIPKSVKRIGANAFYKCKKATIYLELSTIPDAKDGYDFHDDWNSSNLPVRYDSYLTNEK